MPIVNQRVPTTGLPTIDNTWLGKLGETINGGLDKLSEKKSFNKLADLIGEQGKPAASSMQQQGAAPVASGSGINAIPAAIPVDRGMAQGSTYQPFIETVKNGGITNPYALSAIAATGRAESGYSPENANRSWSDPSQSGHAGMAGGIMSWRGPRLASLQSYAQSKGEQGNGSPQTQGEFLLQENPQLVAQLNQAKSPQEAASMMANAWKFAGYDQQGGEAARRQALTQNYYAQQFGKDQTPAEQAINAQAPQQPAGFDSGRFGGATPVAAGIADLGSALAASNAQPQAAQTGYVDPQVTAATQQQPAAAAQQQPMRAPAAPSAQQNGIIAAGITPIPKGAVPIDLIQTMLRDPNLRQAGLQLWQQNVTGKTSEPWQFVNLQDGTLARANQQTGEIQTVGRFGKGVNGLGADEAGLNLVYGQDADGNTIAFQPLKGGGLKQVEVPTGVKLMPGVSNIDLGTSIQTRNNKTGAVIADTPKDVQGTEFNKTTGKSQADARAALPQVESSAEQMIATIDSLNSDPYLPSMLGPVNSRLPNATGDSARVQSKLDQITGQAFLQAYNTLRGGGQITEVEGQKATAAMGRLNTAQNEQDFRDALQELRGIISAGVERARKNAGQAAPAANQTKSGVTWSIEE
jgi:hypothetical protein